MKHEMKDLMKEEDRQMISGMLEGISTLLDELKTEFKSPKEQKIIDMAIGNNPAYMFLQPFLEKKKSVGELLLGESDWSEYIASIKELIPENPSPSQNVLETTKMEYPKGEHEGQRIIQLLTQIVNLLYNIANCQLKITNMLASIYEELHINNE